MTVPAPPAQAAPAAACCAGAEAPQRVPHAEKAWEWFRSIGAPKYHVAPMVDQSELPFRMLCRDHGATCAYTPMLHARIFSQDKKYREEMLTTCPEDRPLFVQFCSNEPSHLLKAAKIVEAEEVCDAIDINFGCPQRIAKRGGYGAFLMDDLGKVEAMVRTLAQNLTKIPVTAKIRIFPDIAQTVAYARMVEAAGAYLVAVHGRLREQKDLGATRADWDHIRAVKQALSVPVLANGNIRHMGDVAACLAYTGCDGVLSAEGLLADPGLFAPHRVPLAVGDYEPTPLERLSLAEQYMAWVARHPVPMRMVRGHVHKMINDWLAEHTDLRERANRAPPSVEMFTGVVAEVRERQVASGRDYPEPLLTEAELAAMDKEEAKRSAIEEQERETERLAALEAEELIIDWSDMGCGC
ncbi:hypothetical protein HYH03_007316 [Edaphochlamys debaryana]|uniref:tRNA-dihydrouridine(16/17) synthase [NAD(P)(+)] n=1 Tax=Edaphochlamys debaryana TaxID=47281 RepID=A0A835Y3I3_9CHLO|nr:hypothetical protein HYH03_007316 [Edaphochlamys debaryana]|eukprot:KAG2494549.1 hypothetical protein HYH03_007316 [Edaphochlamys debaryana]